MKSYWHIVFSAHFSSEQFVVSCQWQLSHFIVRWFHTQDSGLARRPIVLYTAWPSGLFDEIIFKPAEISDFTDW